MAISKKEAGLRSPGSVRANRGQQGEVIEVAIPFAGRAKGEVFTSRAEAQASGGAFTPVARKFAVRFPGEPLSTPFGSKAAAEQALIGIREQTIAADIDSIASKKRGQESERLAGIAEQFGERQSMIDELAGKRFAAETRFLESSREIQEARWRDWNEIYAPIEREVVADAQIGRDPEIIADRARAAVAQQFERSREAGIRRLSQSGVTAGSPTGMQFLRGLDIGEAATRAGEANRARDTTMAQNEARRFNALSLGQGIPALAGGQSLQGASLAGGAGRGLLSLGAQTGEAAARLGLARDQFDQRERFGLAGLDLDRARLDFQRQSGLQNFTLNERRLDLQDPNVFGTQNYIRGGLALGGGLLSGKDFGTSALAGLEGLLR